MSPTELTENGPLYSYYHDHPEVKNVNEVHDSKMTVGQKVADRVASLVGSWPFIITQSVVLFFWIVANVYFAIHPGALKAFDPYPFILLNLALSFQAAYTGPIVMMSQNRQSEKDRLVAQSDYQCNQTAETEIRLLMDHLMHQDKIMDYMIEKIDKLEARLSEAKSGQP
ncbi:MAG: DUF1003 domain-containing protein [Armatimonadetes bacterium]|nr:DUF1003 domain-containing protein [Armatimonadota bacterium]